MHGELKKGTFLRKTSSDSICQLQQFTLFGFSSSDAKFQFMKLLKQEEQRKSLNRNRHPQQQRLDFVVRLTELPVSSTAFRSDLIWLICEVRSRKCNKDVCRNTNSRRELDYQTSLPGPRHALGVEGAKSLGFFWETPSRAFSQKNPDVNFPSVSSSLKRDSLFLESFVCRVAISSCFPQLLSVYFFAL